MFNVISPSTMTPRQKRISVDIFAALVIVSIALALANLTWRLAGYDGVKPTAVPAGPLSGASDIAPLLALAPFGIANNAVIEQGSSDLVLRAIFAAIPASDSVALIAGPDGQVIPFGIGDATPGGIVEAIDPEKVTLRTSGGLRVLGFDPDEAGDATPSGITPAPNAPAASTNDDAPAASQPSGVDAIRALIPPGSQADDDAPSQDTPPIEPSRQGAASQSGYRVGNSVPAPLRAAGIRSGDVIRTFNGDAVASGTSSSELMRKAMAAGSARVELIRDGKQVSLTVPIR